MQTMLQSSQEPKIIDLKTQPLWVQALGWLGGLGGVAFCFLFVAASCTANPKADGSVIVDDQANILAPWAKAAIKEIRFPEDIPTVVRTVSSIPPQKIGTFATDLMLEEPHWQTLRPRGLLRKFLRNDPPSGPGVYVLVSLKPQLLQIRFGPAIRLSAYQNLIAVGTWYRDQQRFERSALDAHVVHTIKELAQKMDTVANPPWPFSWAQYLSSFVISQIEDIFEPSDGLFSKMVLRNHIMLANSIGATGSVWRFMAFNGVVFVILWLVKLLIDWLLLLLRIENVWFWHIVVKLSSLVLFSFLLAEYASLAALSKGRVEDELELEVLGLSFLSIPGFDATLFSTQGGIWLAVPGAVVSLLGAARQDEVVDGWHRQHIPIEWLLWGCLLFLLPKAIAIVVLVVVVRRTYLEIAKSVSAERERRLTGREFNS